MSAPKTVYFVWTRRVPGGYSRPSGGLYSRLPAARERLAQINRYMNGKSEGGILKCECHWEDVDVAAE